MNRKDLIDLIEEGENIQCEFKRHFTTPEKIAREMIAFANTKGGYILFGIEVKGSIFLLFITILIFLFASTSIGIFVSAISNSQQLAFSLGTSLSLLPSVILSGFIFPIDSMPVIIQMITNLTPAKYFIVILRAIIVRGVGLEAFWQHFFHLLQLIPSFQSI